MNKNLNSAAMQLSRSGLGVFLCLACLLTIGQTKRCQARKILQATAAVQAIAIENLSGLTSNRTASAAAAARATAYSVTPLPPIAQCLTFANTNYNGDVLFFINSVADVGRCCELCSTQPGCNIMVYCPQVGGCDDGAGRIYPFQLCTLKNQRLVAGTSPGAYGAGPQVPWISGILSQSSLGLCVGFAEAAASAEAEAGCGSVAYAVAIASAVDTCGNTAAAEALAVAIGGICPISCDSAVATMQSAAASFGCTSSEFAIATDAATSLCGADRFAQLTATICPETCEGATAAAEASIADGAGCGTIVYGTAIAQAAAACRSAFASATATAIGGRCPVDCGSAVSAAGAAEASAGCNSTIFGQAQATAVLLCGAENYSARAAALGGICTIGVSPPTDDVIPPPGPERQPVTPIIVAPPLPEVQPIITFEPPVAPLPAPSPEEQQPQLVVPDVIVPSSIVPATEQPPDDNIVVIQPAIIITRPPAPEIVVTPDAVVIAPPAPETAAVPTTVVIGTVISAPPGPETVLIVDQPPTPPAGPPPTQEGAAVTDRVARPETLTPPPGPTGTGAPTTER